MTPLNKVKGQCAFLAGHGIQGETLAKALHKCRGLILVPREYLAQRLGYLYNELGCTAKAKPAPKLCILHSGCPQSIVQLHSIVPGRAFKRLITADMQACLSMSRYALLRCEQKVIVLTRMAMVQDISRCVGLLGIRAEMLAMRVALLRHLGRQIQFPSQARPKPPCPLARPEPQPMSALPDQLAAGLSLESRYQPQAVSADAKEVFCSEDRCQNPGG